MHDDEHTPPRGGAIRNSRYAKVNDRELLERAADNAFQARHDVKKLRDEHAEFRAEVRLALRPYVRPWYERGAMAAIAAILLVWLLMWSTLTSSSAAPEPRPRVQAGR
ncbi:MAG: hypothetical protein ACYCPT_02090 [Acidimicrobiales bacterium]